MFGLFGSARNKIREAIRKEAAIIDVRTVHEYDQGRMPGSINIPIERIPVSVERIRHLKKPVIFCSNGDSRSGIATRIMKQHGLTEVYDGGNWEKVLKISNGV